MEAKVLKRACLLPPPLPTHPAVLARLPVLPFPSSSKPKYSSLSVLRRSMSKDEPLIDGLPKEYYDDEWQARQREKTKELHRRRQEEDEEEERKVQEYREIAMRLQGYPEEDLKKARRLVSSFIIAAEEVEEKIEEAAERGELTELVLMVIWNRLDLARRDEEKDAIRSLDLLYRRVEHQGPLRPPLEDDDTLLRVDFVREVDALLQEVRHELSEPQDVQGFDPESVASRLKQQEKKQTIRQVEALLDLAINLKW